MELTAISTTHYIYEIKGVKVGCTVELKQRVRRYNGKYKLKDLIILEILNNKSDKEAGEIEQEYQKKLGYSLDKSPYHESKERSIRGSFSGRSKGGKNGVKTNRKNGTGLFNKENPPGRLGGRASSAKQRLNKTGIIFNEELAKKAQKKSQETNKKNKTGVYSPEVRKLAQVKAVISNKKNKTGCWDSNVQIRMKETSRINKTGFYSSESQRENSKKGLKSQKENKTGIYSRIKCKYCGLKTNPGNIGRYHNEKCKYKLNEEKDGINSNI